MIGMRRSHSLPRAKKAHPARSRSKAAARLIFLLAALTGTVATAEDWPMYRHDVARSGITPERVRLPLRECWAFKPHYPPAPAWGDPKPEPVENILELRRVHFDDAFQVAAVDGAVYFGSSADHKVYCLEAAGGRVRWTRITGGPVRLAPTVVGGKVFVGSDDGCAYCLDADDGSVEWKFRAAPGDARVLGSGKMISLWPLRTGVLVDDGAAYFAAGIFPAEGVFLYAVDAKTGREIWRNDTCGEDPQSKVSPQGYLLASESTLYAPMGRVSPAAFDRRDGQLKYLTFFGKPVGGTYALLAGEDVYTGTEEMVAYHGQSRDRFAAFTGRKIVVTEKTAYVATETELSALDRTTFPAASRKLYDLSTRRAALDRALATARRQRDESEAQRQECARLEKEIAALEAERRRAEQQFAACIRWKVPCRCHESLILAGDVLVAGGQNEVVAIQAESGKTLWTATVHGTAKGLAVAEGRLLVSTDTGMIHCFAPEGSRRSGTVTPPVDADPFAGSKLAGMFERAAETILRESGIRRGYCLVLGCPTGQLALELARRSDLMIYVVEPDEAKVAAARAAFDAAGLYGVRICVDQWPEGEIPYSDYFANLIVSETTLVTGELPAAPAQIARMLKPCGGTLLLGQPTPRPAEVKPLGADTLRRWLEELKLRGPERITAAGTWAKIVRGPLPGAGSWTHQYADPGNTACGDDLRVKCPLGVLWFGRPGPGKMVNRHRRAAAPLCLDGRMFVQGENVVMAYDAYNGLKLWERDIPGAMRINVPYDCSNLAISSRGLFVAVEDHCLRLDPASGRTLATYSMPPGADASSSRWGYVACADGVLYGSRTSGGRQSDGLFALDAATGEVRWTYEDERIHHAAIAIGDGKVFFVSSHATPDQRRQAIEEARRRIDTLPKSQRAAAEADVGKIAVQRVVALGAEDGKRRWQKPIDASHLGGSNVAAMYNNGVLVIFGVYLDGHYWQQFFAGEFASRRVVALSGEDGRWLWSRAVGYRVRPLIIGDTLHAEPWAFDLHTGQPKTRIHPVTGQEDQWQFARPGHHCGCPSASPYCLFFRSYNFGYYDLLGDYGTMHFGAQRAGCWINLIPAAGLLLAPEASAGCMCPFPNMCTVVFKPSEENRAWAYYSAPGPMTPVRHLALNLGASGDRTDAAGTLWLGYPRPGGSLVLQFEVDRAFYSGGSFVKRNSAFTAIAGTDKPWLFASAAQGLRKCTIPLLAEGDGTALYRVRLAFADPENDQPGRRVFDIKLQGQVVQEDFDVVREAGGRDRAVFKEFTGIEVSDRLAIELVAKTARPEPHEAPILQGVEITRQEVVRLGCAATDFLLSNHDSKQTGELKLSNIRDDSFEGTLKITAPDGFQLTPNEVEVTLASGERTIVPLEAAVAAGVRPGNYKATVKLLRSDGTLELERDIAIEHLGRRSRAVFKPVEDASVSRRYPDMNKGSASVLLVDGGSQTMGDRDHAQAYLKFLVDIPGRASSVRLRIHNAGNPSSDAGRICLASGSWREAKVTYSTRPTVGKELARIGRIVENRPVECPLEIDLEGSTELSLMIDPTSCDGVDYLSRESDKPPQLIIEYEPRR